ncbi:hypothetical protein AB1285_23585 [Microbacterium sp. NRRL B-14842]|uniref:hypothetical protein n=1 Tax=Microbacterium sp. NRRL B-14842 TaxID=3162881 RepID=UPI003D28BFB4
MPQLNLGGGFGIAYTRIDDPTPIDELAGGIVAAVAEGCAARGIPVPALSFEPGRAIVGTAGVTLYEVGTTKDVTVASGATRRYVSVDGGMSDNARTALYGASYSARLASRAERATRSEPGGRQALRVRRHRRRSRISARATSPRGTCSRCPRRARTAPLSRATTTTSRGRRSWRCARAARG